MSALWNTFRLTSLFPTTREENWPFISSAHWAHAPPCCSPGTRLNTALCTPAADSPLSASFIHTDKQSVRVCLPQFYLCTNAPTTKLCGGKKTLCILPHIKITQTQHLSPCFSRPNDFSSEGFNDWAFMTTHSWDEDPRGEWTLEIENIAANGRDYGNLTHHH